MKPIATVEDHNHLLTHQDKMNFLEAIHLEIGLSKTVTVEEPIPAGTKYVVEEYALGTF